MSGDEARLVAECKAVADLYGVYVEWISQRGGKNSGTSRGAPDCFVYVNAQVLPVEFKRAKNSDGTPAGCLSLDQIVAMERRADQGVTTNIVTSAQQFGDMIAKAKRRRT